MIQHRRHPKRDRAERVQKSGLLGAAHSANPQLGAVEALLDCRTAELDPFCLYLKGLVAMDRRARRRLRLCRLRSSKLRELECSGVCGDNPNLSGCVCTLLAGPAQPSPSAPSRHIQPGPPPPATQGPRRRRPPPAGGLRFRLPLQLGRVAGAAGALPRPRKPRVPAAAGALGPGRVPCRRLPGAAAQRGGAVKAAGGEPGAAPGLQGRWQPALAYTCRLPCPTLPCSGDRAPSNRAPKASASKPFAVCRRESPTPLPRAHAPAPAPARSCSRAPTGSPPPPRRPTTPCGTLTRPRGCTRTFWPGTPRG